MRRRALLASCTASAVGGGEFYCELWHYHPRIGYMYVRTATFITPTQITWGEAVGLIDTEERTQIVSISLPSGTTIFTLINVNEDDIAVTFRVEGDPLPSENIGIGRTYKCLMEY